MDAATSTHATWSASLEPVQQGTAPEGLGLLRLNEDVLFIIISNLSQRDALNLMVTARGLHLIAKRHALSSVTLHTHEQISKLCTYMLGDIDGRLYWLHSLTVRASIAIERSSVPRTGTQRRYNEATEESACHIAALLENATSLRVLTLEPLDLLLDIEPRIGTALSALPDLAELELFNVGRARSLKVLNNLQSSPRKLALRVARPSVSCNAIFSTLMHLQTLQTVSLLDINRYHGIEHPPDEIDHQYSWPLVRDLTLDACRISMPVAVHAFPNLRVLRVPAYIPCPPHAKVAIWPSLDYVEGSAEFFQGWQITCRVHHIVMQSVLAMASLMGMGLGPPIITRWGELALPITLQVVRQTTPAILSFPIMSYPELASTFWTDLAKSATRLYGLEIELCNFYETAGLLLSLNQWMEIVPPILGMIPTLVFVTVSVDYSMRRNIRRGTLEQEAAVPPPIIPTLSLHESFATLLVKGIPSVRYVSVTFSSISKMDARRMREEAFAPRWWRAVGTGAERKAESITEMTGERMRAKLISPGFDPSL